MGDDFVLDDALNWGTLPTVTRLQTVSDKSEYLRAYVNTYLKEEIKEAAQASGKILNYSKIARDSRSDDSSVKRYFEILEDTLLGVRMDPFHRSIRKRESEPSWRFRGSKLSRRFFRFHDPVWEVSQLRSQTPPDPLLRPKQNFSLLFP